MEIKAKLWAVQSHKNRLVGVPIILWAYLEGAILRSVGRNITGNRRQCVTGTTTQYCGMLPTMWWGTGHDITLCAWGNAFWFLLHLAHHMLDALWNVKLHPCSEVWVTSFMYSQAAAMADSPTACLKRDWGIIPLCWRLFSAPAPESESCEETWSEEESSALVEFVFFMDTQPCGLCAVKRVNFWQKAAVYVQRRSKSICAMNWSNKEYKCACVMYDALCSSSITY